MNTDIRYIFLDLGGTFRVIDEDPAYLAAARAKIAELCGVKTEDPTQWFEDVIDKRYDVYREWALKYMCEAPEEVLWRRWLAYDCDPELIRRNASELCYQYRQTKGRRTVVEGGADTVKELCRRGYTVNIGKTNDGEIDFVATRQNEKLYVQVTERITSEKAERREYDRLLDIRDNYPKYVLRTDDFAGGNYEGIQTMHVADFLLSDRF